MADLSNSPEITGIICTRNRERYLERCILSLFEQTLDPDRYEILVVDNGSTDSTRAICERFLERPGFRYLFEPVAGLSRARNTGWQQARGRYIGYIDDDAFADPQWFAMALEAFHSSSPEPEWVGGPVQLDWEVPAPAWLTRDYYGALGWVDWGDKPRFLEGAGEWLVGCNSLYRRDILELLNGFDTRLGRKKKLLLSGEEVQFQHRLKAINGRLYYHPGICIFHAVPEERTRPSFFYRRYYWGGITDYIMSKTLEDVAYESIAGDGAGESRLKRLLLRTVQATGLFTPSVKKIQSRIYLAYVLGRLVAVVKYGWRKMDLDKV
jgi:glycosyltransferase involved in cell wall biosynthesis